MKRYDVWDEEIVENHNGNMIYFSGYEAEVKKLKDQMDYCEECLSKIIYELQEQNR